MKRMFKKTVSAIICTSLMLVGGISYGEENKVLIFVENEPFEYSVETGMPYINSDGKTMVPLAATLNALGATVTYDDSTKTITATHDDDVVIIPLGKKYIELEGKKLVLETRTRMKEGKSYGPIAPIVSALRMTADWNEQLNAVSLSDTPTYELLNLVDTVSKEDDRVELVEPKIVQTGENVDTSFYSKVLGSSKTTFNAGNKSRSINIRVATESLNGVVLKPGEVFSYNTVVGSRSTSRGYVASTVISGGEYVTGVGGGVCQVSSTLFAAALDANMTIVERHPHSLVQTYLPAGKDATVYYGSLDFKFKNPYDYPVVISSAYDSKGAITISIRGVEEIAKPQVKVNIYKNKSGAYVLERTADGVKNYSTSSKYKG